MSSATRRFQRFAAPGLAAGAGALLFSSAALGQTIHTIPTFGAPPSGDDISVAYALNSNGSVVVGRASATGTLASQAFRWTIGGGIQNLGLAAGGAEAVAWDVSDNGNLVVGAGPSESFAEQVWRWTNPGPITSMGIFGGTARGVSGNGTFIAGTHPAGGFYRWTSAGGFQLLGNYPGTTQGACSAISADGTTLVGFSGLGVFGSTNHAVKWSSTSGWTDLGLSGNYARGLACSADGQIVVGEANYAFPTFIHAVRWNGAVMEDLGIPPNAATVTPNSVSSDGTFIGGTIGPQAGATRAFVWTETFGFEDLDQYLLGRGVDISGWAQFYDVRGISADGTAICGWGRVFPSFAPRAFVVRGLSPVCGPRITAQPQGSVTCVGGSTFMFVDAFGPTLFLPQYQWQKRGSDGEWNDLPNMTSPWGSVFSGTNTSYMTISNCSATDVPGLYRCRVTAGCATISTAIATVSLINQAPAFTGQPSDYNTCPGDTATFVVGPPTPANGPYTYQWERETFPNSGVFVALTGGFTYSWDGNVPGYGGIVSGQNSPTLVIAPDTGNSRVLGPPHSRNYRCVVFNPCAATVSVEAGLKAFTSCITGDANCDNTVSVGDISAFVLALTNAPQYAIDYGDCNPDNVDINNDNTVSVGDIAGFVALLTGG
ncbi:MAG: hypothetical protein SF069_10250 [Phycisphaerae bacterium]|nr:hypothetical protein [Phycisphaerae bacterium]